MDVSREIEIDVPGEAKVSGILEIPKPAMALLVLAHGAGAGMRHPAIKALSMALHRNGIGTLRYQFPYMERGSKRPDSPTTAVATVEAAVQAAAKAAPKLPLFAGGKSFGGRMTTTAASEGKLPSIRGIVCFGFPLHPARQPGTSRAEHLSKVTVPTLLLQGTRDDLSDLTLLRPIVKELGERFILHELEGADHGYAVLVSSGRTGAQILQEVAHVTAAFCARFRK